MMACGIRLVNRVPSSGAGELPDHDPQDRNSHSIDHPAQTSGRGRVAGRRGIERQRHHMELHRLTAAESNQ